MRCNFDPIGLLVAVTERHPIAVVIGCILLGLAYDGGLIYSMFNL